MNIERFIAVYEKESKSLIEDLQIDLSAEQLIEILGIDKNDDPDVYKQYEITEPQFEKLKTLLPELQNFDFNKFEINLECFSIE